jgi:chromosome partitioning protein
VCIQTAFYLAIKEQAKTLVLDFDAQGNTSSRLVPHETNSEGELVPVYSGTRVVDLFKKDIGPIEVIHCPCGVDLIHTLKNDHDLSEIETGLTLVDALNPRENLRELIQQYDYVLIDCPPSLGRKLYAALAMSTHVVAPVKLSGFAYDGLEGLLRTLIGVQHSTNPILRSWASSSTTARLRSAMSVLKRRYARLSRISCSKIPSETVPPGYSNI